MSKHKRNKTSPFKMPKDAPETSYRAVPIQEVRAADGTTTKRGILTTEAPVMMPDWERMEMVPEVLVMSGCTTRGKDLKLVDCHSTGTVRNVLGSFRDIQRHPASAETPFRHMDGIPDVSKAEPAIRTKLEEGHISEMSVGYSFKPSGTVYIEAGETFEHEGRTWEGPLNLRTKWSADEASLVILGADEQAQIRGFQSLSQAFSGESTLQNDATQNGENPHQVENQPKPTRATGSPDKMDPENQPEKKPAQPAAPQASPALAAGGEPDADLKAKIRAAVQDNSERSSAILSLGEKFGCTDKAQSAIRNDVSVEQFARDIAGNLPAPQPVQADPIPWEKKEAQSYNLGRALQLIALGEKVDGLEGELSKAVGERSGKGDTKGFFLPSSQDFQQFAGERTTLTAGTAATLGNVVQTSLAADQYMPYFKPTPIMWALGAQVITGVRDNFDISTGLTSPVADTKAESTAHAESNPTSKKVSFTPHAYGFYTVVSKRLLRQSAIATEAYLTEEMNDAVTVKLDQDGLNGAGSGSDECDGIIGHTDAATVTIASATAPTYAEIMEFEQEVETANALGNKLAYVTTPALKKALKATPEYGNDRDPIWTPNSARQIPSEGVVNGYRAVSTNQCPAGRIVFGDFSKYIYVVFDGIEITVSEDATLTRQRDVQFCVNMDIDGQPKYGEAFATDA